MRIERGPDPGPFSKHTDYKPYLQRIFRSRCAYCLTPDRRNGGLDGMTVDHFRPLVRYPGLRLAWSNLYYSCSPCNSHYKKDHPTEDEEAEGYRFVDPCGEDPDDHFRMTRDPKTRDFCRVRPLSDAARYTLRILRFNDRKPLRDFWRELDRLERETVSRKREIEYLLKEVQSDIRSRGASKEIQNVHSDLLGQLHRCKNRLAEIRLMRPFPVDNEEEARLESGNQRGQSVQ